MLKRSFYLSVLIIIFSQCSLFSQGFEGGISLGLATTQVEGDGHGGYDKAGPIIGVWTSRKFSKNIHGSIEVRYIQKGSYAKSQIDGITVGFYRMRLNYTEIPVMVTYNLNSKMNFSAGLGVAYLWKATESNNIGAFPEEDIAQFRNYEVSARVGAEFLISSKLHGCLNFSYSLLPVRLHNGNITYRLDKGQYNNVIELLLKYRIGR